MQYQPEWPPGVRQGHAVEGAACQCRRRPLLIAGLVAALGAASLLLLPDFLDPPTQLADSPQPVCRRQAGQVDELKRLPGLGAAPAASPVAVPAASDVLAPGSTAPRVSRWQR
ncbi:MAG: hypothetical protein RMK29_02550 [Myxococcales bacterium]|nr:hypothetical protein [Myxococcota bacterium]MDW8280561.1 hypothetical protein [Myxococcales bacterium]